MKVAIPFAGGINTSLPDKGNPVTELLNLDVLTGEGGVQTRPGRELVNAVALPHSLVSLPPYTEGFVVAGSELLRVNEQGVAVRVALLQSSDPMHYCQHPYGTLASNGTDLLLIPQGTGDAQPFGVPTPPYPPAVDALTTGGTVQVAIAYATADGMLGAASPVITIEASSVRLTGIPQPIGGSIWVYASLPGGDDLYRQAVLPVGTDSVDLLRLGRSGPRLPSETLDSFPPCRLIETWHGRLYGAQGSFLIYSQPMNYHLRAPMIDFIALPGEITMIAPVEGGIYVCAGPRVYFLAGTDATDLRMQVTRVSPVRPGSLCRVAPQHLRGVELPPAPDYPVWLGQDGGWYAGTSDGAPVMVHRQPAAAGNGPATSYLIDIGKLVSMVTLTRGDPESARGRDRFTASVRN